MVSKKIKFTLYFFSFLLVLTSLGCTLYKKAPQLRTLKSLAQSQQEMSLYVEEKEANFVRLTKDIQAGRLAEMTSYEEIIAYYGEPVLRRNFQKEGLAKELLYRHPTEYFDTDKVYLYFDSNLKLDSWIYQKAD